jgi:hypothetical protein
MGTNTTAEAKSQTKNYLKNCIIENGASNVYVVWSPNCGGSACATNFLAVIHPRLEIHLNNIYNFSFHLTKNTYHLRYKQKSFRVI